MNHPPFRFVIVGTGIISNAYVAAIKNLPGMELAGIISRSGKKPDSVAEDLSVPIASCLTDLKAPFDAVILATPNGTHHAQAIEAANMGKHVLSEKVLDISLDACDRMIAACAQNKVKLGVAYQRRTSPDNRRLKLLLEQGALGKIFAVELEAAFYRGQDYYDSGAYRGTRSIDGGGPFFQQAAHDLDLLVWFFGMPVHVASALGTFLHQIESEDHGAAVMKFASGAIGTVMASTCCQPPAPAKITLRSDLGTLVLSGDRFASVEMKGIDAARLESTLVEELPGGQEGILRDFVNAVREDRPPLISGEEGRRSVELIRRIYESEIGSVK